MQKKYDYYKQYPKSRRNTVILSILSILFINLCLIISNFHIGFMIFALVFNLMFIWIIFNVHKNQIIIFDKQKITIQWYSLFKNINTTVSAVQINKIQFKVFVDRDRKSSMHQIIINIKNKKPIKLTVIPAQYYDLMEYFKEFCDTNFINLVGYVKDDD